MTSATVGGSLALPIVISNLSKVGRPIFVKGIWVREGQGDWIPCVISWDRLEAGTEKPATLIAREMDRVGIHPLEILFCFASQWSWREEQFAFSTSLEINVEENQSIVVNQNISGDGTNYQPIHVNVEGKRSFRSTGARDRRLPLTRATVYERDLDIRGVERVSIPRGVEFRWSGFAEGLTPLPGAITTSNSLFSFGRSRTKMQGGPTDVRLLAVNANGSLDEDTSQMVSREHFWLWLENDRLMIRSQSENGVWVDGKTLLMGDVAVLRDRSRFSPLTRFPERLEMEVRFQVEHRSVVGIEVRRVN